MLKERIKKIYLYRHTLWDMAISQLKTKYAGSILGISWAIINPLLIMSAITFVFTIIFKTEIKNFAFFVLSGIFPWMFFSNALSEAATSILTQQNILRQFNLPREFLPLSSLLSSLLNFLIGWLIIYPLFLFFNPKIILLLPLLIIALLLNFFFVCGLGLILSILNVFFRDIGQLLGVLLMFWFWITPVFYSIDMIPVRFLWICKLNPMAYYIILYQDILFKTEAPSISTFLITLLISLMSFVLGYLFFLKKESILLKRI
jgi:ABC-2 type transport system permease protein